MHKSVVLTDILEITRLKINLISVFLFHNKGCDFHTGKSVTFILDFVKRRKIGSFLALRIVKIY